MLEVDAMVGNVRRLVKDEDLRSPRYSDEDLYAALTTALATVRHFRPDAFQAAFGSALPAVGRSGQIDLDPSFQPAVEKIAAGEVLLSNTEFAEAGTAQGIMQLGIAWLTARAGAR